MTQTPFFELQIAKELTLPLQGVAAVIKLLDEGNTIPFIARYRKEATSNLDETHIRTIQERLNYLKELTDRRQTILQSLEAARKQLLLFIAKHKPYAIGIRWRKKSLSTGKSMELSRVVGIFLK